MFVKSNSTGKSKDKQQLIRMTEYSTCSKLLTNKTDYKRPQPIKIAQLLGQSENLKTIQKDSVRKRAQPERLGTLSNKKYSGINKEQSETSTCIQSSKKSARRILNFSAISTNTKDNNENKNQLNKIVINEQFHKKISKPVRKSSLIPPNTIKDKFIQNYSEKINKNSKKIKTLKKTNEVSDDLAVKNKIISDSSNININFINNGQVNEEKNIQFSDYSRSKVNDINAQQHETLLVTPKSPIFSNYESSQQIITNNNESKKNSMSPNKNVSKYNISIKSPLKKDCIQNLCNYIQDTKLLASETNMNVEYESSEIICINKNKIIHLECELKDLLKKTEKNMIKLKSTLEETEENVNKLKSTLAFVTRLLCTNDKEITLSNIELKEKNTVTNKEIELKTCCKSIQYAEEQLRTPILHISQITEFSNKNNSIQNDENKENKDWNIRSDIETDRSFLELENQLNIMHAKPIHDYSIQSNTPIITKYKQKRSFREYMALKSSINFLETPDGKKFKSLCQMDDVDKSVLNVTYISNKLLTDLHTLYSESPDS
ncbi:origin recognition complex subunit 1-like [Apis laboriosa]|uniref:origin recognition complex subunit 1-like n=1 Tax=Apis laboriosa TaxID=183418 RepID=UPI001CC7E36C|nr:origin recognition complex subunit 1-like [Apis laboriosa]